MLCVAVPEQCLGLRVACVLVVFLRDGQWETLVKTKQNKNLIPARKKKEVIYTLPLASLKEATVCFLLKVYVLCRLMHDMSFICCASRWWRNWSPKPKMGVFLVWNSKLFLVIWSAQIGLICIDFYIKIYATKDTSSASNFTSPFRVLHLHRNGFYYGKSWKALSKRKIEGCQKTA